MTTLTGQSYLNSLSGAASGGSATSTSSTKSNNTIDQAGFLQLLTEQMKDQDPTAPTDNNQMIQQMTSFSQLSGITAMNTSLSSIANDVSASRFGSASSWVGQSALVSSNTATPLSNGYYGGQLTLPSDATDVSINLVDADGKTVKTLDLGAQSGGPVDWAWDGKDTDGKTTLANGKLSLQVTAKAATGSITPDSATWTQVQSVQSPVSGTTKLITGLGTIAPTDVQQLA